MRWPAWSNSSPVNRWSDLLRVVVRWDHWARDFCRTASNSAGSMIGGCSPGRISFFVFDLADLEVVTQKIVQRAAAERDATAGPTRRKRFSFGPDVPLPKVPNQFVDAARFEVRLED